MSRKNMKTLEKYIKYEKKLFNDSFLKKCLNEINLNIIHALIIRKNLERKMTHYRIKRIFMFVVTILFCYITMRFIN